MVSGGFVKRASGMSSNPPSTSVARTVNALTPSVPDIPLITPVALRLTPTGRLPPASDQVYGALPPAAASVVVEDVFAFSGRSVVVVTI